VEWIKTFEKKQLSEKLKDKIVNFNPMNSIFYDVLPFYNLIKLYLLDQIISLLLKITQEATNHY
jgi:hypothetical protein